MLPIAALLLLYCCLIAAASLRDVSRARARALMHRVSHIFPACREAGGAYQRIRTHTYTHTHTIATYAAAHISRRCQPLEQAGGTPNPRNYEGLCLLFFLSPRLFGLCPNTRDTTRATVLILV